MDKEILTKSEKLLREINKISKFSSKYNVAPYQRAGQIVDEMKELVGSISEIENPQNKDQLIQAELKRRLNGEILNIEQRLSTNNLDFNTVISMYGIPRSDIDGLKGWLLKNKEKTLESIERLFKTEDIKSYELGLSGDIPEIRQQAEGFTSIHIKKYHRNLGNLLENLTKVGGYLREIEAVPTTNPRSYFHPLTKTLAIGIPAICFATEDKGLHIKERELITLYGHEGMGHALNHIITQNNDLPYFLKTDSSLVTSTNESVAQFYQNIIFEDLKESPETQKALGIQHKFDEIYQEAKDASQLKEYPLKVFQYAITVLADKSLGNPQDPKTIDKKIELINEITLDPAYPRHIVEQYRYSFDSQGNLNPQLVSELRYAAQPVQRALKEFAKKGMKYEGKDRNKIDATLLRGFWTPIGYVDNARLKADEE